MPAAAKKKELPPAPPPRVVHTAGQQEDFAEPAAKLAQRLGWSGDPDWETNDITVADACNYITKVMHEHFQAGARGEAQPDYQAAYEHLAVDNAGEQAAIDAALATVYQSGKGVTVTEQPASAAGLSANLTGSGNAMLGKLAGSEKKAKG